MKKNKFVKDTVSVVSSNVVVLISSILTGLVIPGIIGVIEYGYYRTFTLYMTYTALLHFGYVDGVLLKYAGVDYDSLNKREFRVNTRFYLIMQLLIQLIMIISSVVFFEGRSRWLLLLVSIDTFAINTTSYYQYVSQCTMRFKELSIKKTLQAFLKIALVAIIYIVRKLSIINTVSATNYIFSIVCIDLLLLMWYMFIYRDITFGKSDTFQTQKKNIKNFFKTGIILTLTYQTTTLIFSIDSQFVLSLFDTKTYAVYAFAYSLISMATAIMGPVSYVLFPNMKQKSDGDNLEQFSDCISIVMTVVFAANIGYFILYHFIGNFLPQYYDSLKFVRIIFPGLSLSSCISVVIFNYYKLLKRIGVFWLVSGSVLIISAVLNCFAYTIWRTPVSISIASIITLFIWFIFSQVFYIKKFKIKWFKNLMFTMIMSVIFWLLSSPIINNLLGAFLYSALFVIISLWMNNKVLKKYIKKLFGKQV